MKESNKQAIKDTISLEEFRAEGYLQEVNRQFFHPLGLALAITMNHPSDWETARLIVLDARRDPEGFMFMEIDALQPLAIHIQNIVNARKDPQVKALGFWEQPV